MFKARFPHQILLFLVFLSGVAFAKEKVIKTVTFPGRLERIVVSEEGTSIYCQEADAICYRETTFEEANKVILEKIEVENEVYQINKVLVDYTTESSEGGLVHIYVIQ